MLIPSLRRTAVRFAALLAVLSMVAVACGRSREASTIAVTYQGTLQVTNNLREPLQLRASAGSTVLWTGSVAAGAKAEGSLGSITAGSFLSLRATNSRGAIVSARDSVIVRNDTLIWIIP